MVYENIIIYYLAYDRLAITVSSLPSLVGKSEVLDSHPPKNAPLSVVVVFP